MDSLKNFWSVGYTNDLTYSDSTVVSFTAKTGLITSADRASSCLQSIPFTKVSVSIVQKAITVVPNSFATFANFTNQLIISEPHSGDEINDYYLDLSSFSVRGGTCAPT